MQLYRGVKALIEVFFFIYKVCYHVLRKMLSHAIEITKDCIQFLNKQIKNFHIPLRVTYMLLFLFLF